MKKIYLTFCIIAISTTIFSQSAEDYLNLGDKKLKLNNYEEAISDYSMALELDPNFVWAYSSRGFCWNRLERYRLAIADYTVAIKLSNDEHAIQYAYCNRGESKRNLKDYKGAIIDYNKAIDLNSKYAHAYAGRGISNSLLGNQSSGLMDLNRAIELNNNNSWWFVSRATIRTELGDYIGALQDYDRALALDSNGNKVYMSRGLVKAILKDHVGAIKDYNIEIIKNPKYGKAYYARGGSKWVLGKSKEACEDCRQASKLGYVETSGLLDLKCDSISLSGFNREQKAYIYSNQEVISHLNQLTADNNMRFIYSGSILTCIDCSVNSPKQIIDIRNVSDIEVDNSHVILKCRNDNLCGTSVYPSGFEMPRSNILINSQNYLPADKIANALRFLVDKAKKSNNSDDPFASFSKEHKKNGSVIDLKIGMYKNAVFNYLRSEPVLEASESNYEIYKVRDQGGTYFLYFYYNKLDRVDKGEIVSDAITIIIN